MGQSYNISPSFTKIVPLNLSKRFNVIAVNTKGHKLCLLSNGPLSELALMELKQKTGFEDFEVQLVGIDVIGNLLDQYKHINRPLAL